ncbi:hypothetical protein B296_00011361, partial [Ensete ventricosum]
LIELWVGNFQKMAESKPAMRKPDFTKVNQLRPGTSGHTLTVKVVSSKTVLQKGRAAGSQVRQMRLAECLVGDETGMIVFTARNEQEVTDPADFTVKEDNNLSLIEYELVTVVEE